MYIIIHYNQLNDNRHVLYQSQCTERVYAILSFSVEGHLDPTGGDYTSRNQCFHLNAPVSCSFLAG